MAKMSFAKAKEEAAVTATATKEDVVDTTSTTAIEVADTTETAIAPAQDLRLGQVSGDVDTSDVRYPQLKLAQSVGPLFEEYNRKPGEIVLKNEISLWEPNLTPACAPLIVTVLKAEKIFVEDLQYGTDEIPRKFKTKEDADAAGLSTDWVDGVKPEVNPMLQTLVLIKQNEKTKDRPEFFVEIGTDVYALAIWNIGGTAYRQAAVDILTESRSSLRSGLHHGAFSLNAIKIKGKANSYWVPRVSLTLRHSPETIKAIEAIKL